jgi:hypothetical protein
VDTTAVGELLGQGWLAFPVRLLVVAGIVGACTSLVAVALAGAA